MVRTSEKSSFAESDWTDGVFTIRETKSYLAQLGEKTCKPSFYFKMSERLVEVGSVERFITDHCKAHVTASSTAAREKTHTTIQITTIIIHQTHYEKSDWSRAFNQFTIACELDMINVISVACQVQRLPGY